MSTSETDPRNGESTEANTPTDGSSDTDDTTLNRRPTDPSSDDTLRRRPTDPSSDDALSGLAGWAVVGVLFIAGIVAPTILYVAGQTGDLQALGLGFKNTYLAVPMVPAILLGAIGIWTALKDR